MFLENDIRSNPHLFLKQKILYSFISNKLLTATGPKMAWSRRPGCLIKGEPCLKGEINFTGTVADWYEFLVKKIEFASNNIFSKTGKYVNFIIVGPDVLPILEMTNTYRTSISLYSRNSELFFLQKMGKLFDIIGVSLQSQHVFCNPYFTRDLLFFGFEEKMSNSDSSVDDFYLAAKENKKTDPNNYGTITIVGL